MEAAVVPSPATISATGRNKRARTDIDRAVCRSGGARGAEADSGAVRGAAAGLQVCRTHDSNRAAAPRPRLGARAYLCSAQGLRMPMDATLLTVAEAGRAIAEGRLSPIALTEAYLERIDALDGELHSYVTVLHEAAHAAAREIAAGRARGPLHGIPIGLKDI